MFWLYTDLTYTQEACMQKTSKHIADPAQTLDRITVVPIKRKH